MATTTNTTTRHTVPNPSFDWREVPEALRLLDDGGVSAISSYIFIDGVRARRARFALGCGRRPKRPAWNDEA